MRPVLLSSTLLLTLAAVSPACALEAGDTMQAWKSASVKERADLLEQILGKDAAGSARVSRCMSETSKAPGHADLPIGEVAKVCALPSNADQPV